MALVGGTNLVLHPFVSLQFARLGVLSQDGCCKSFDNAGNGYARSEAITCILLQKTKDCRRIYAKIVHAKTNCDGYKEQGITFPSGDTQKRLLQEFYLECGVDPRSLSFLEAHGTGTIVGDPEEVNAMDEIFCTDRETPLLIGSVKSNIGHTEPASGLCSITKCVIGLEEGIIPPNINFNKPREGVKALEEGRIKVVSEKMPFEDDRGLVGVNSFGFGGGNCHILLKWNEKCKVNNGTPRDDLPRLVCVSGRTPEAITSLTDDVNSRKLDAEHVQLLHEIFKRNIEGHNHRGYTIISKSGEIKSSQREFLADNPSYILAFGNFEDRWRNLCQDLFVIPVFAAAIERIQNILIKKNVNITEVIHGSQSLKDCTVFHHVLGNIALQIGIIDILKELQVEPDVIVGYALGELSCAYFDGSLTLEQIVLASYEIGIHLQEVKSKSIYVVKADYTQLRKVLPPFVEIIWRNTSDSVTISGELQITKEFVSKLRNEGIEVVEIGVTDVNFHSKDIAYIEQAILPKLKKIIVKPKQRSTKWISASTERTATAEYFVKALQSEVQFQDLSLLKSKNPVVLEIGFGTFSKLFELAPRRL
ncbi:hypothetical protein WA026_005243 [Henosepilachna vigintioctopunctata]|uniref:Ketosynthase family 3 (KS3) domain-containing protein n=1 Tax=Henosepilachna vigintioctopunctata TaxID=420089 RepID=A0AAW1UL28_9CUCU